MSLKIGTTMAGKGFRLPDDSIVQTFALLGIRGCGKTTTAAVIAEEMTAARLPWIALDHLGLSWGLRAKHDGSPNGLSVVVFGGEHGDIPLEKSSGRKIAEALLSEPVPAVIDLSQESKTFWRSFVTDFCLTLMEMNPAEGRHLFIEEAPEFVPQRTRVDLTARCKEAVERLVRLGRNRGYGCTLISQRPATVDKDVLSQCENIFAMRTPGAHDRKALKEWISEKGEGDADHFTNELPKLEDGAAYFWSPAWLRIFEKVQIRQRTTFHPGATRKIGRAAKSVALADVGKFVDRLRRQMSRVQAAPTPKAASRPAPRKTESIAEPQGIWGTSPVDTGEMDQLSQENGRLREQLAAERRAKLESEKRLAAVRAHLQPQYDALRSLFEDLKSNGAQGTVDRSVYEPWLAQAAKAGARRLLETVLERGELQQQQLATLSGIGGMNGKFYRYLRWLKRNNLVTIEGSGGQALVKLNPL